MYVTEFFLLFIFYISDKKLENKNRHILYCQEKYKICIFQLKLMMKKNSITQLYYLMMNILGVYCLAIIIY